MDTIYALSSGRPPAAIAVVRISGPNAIEAATTLAGDLPPPRQAQVRALRDAEGSLLDRVLVLTFPGPNSATGEDLVELHCHGGRAVVTAVEGAVAAKGLRRAEPGEFTRRALTNGRIDLAEAGGLADLLEAETEAERRAALAAAEGRVSRQIGSWLDRLAILSAQVEAQLDFADEEDVTPEPLAPTTAGAYALADEIESVLTAPAVERLREGFRVVIAGPPNAGKSTLLNLLVERDAAIVSSIAGTTRDLIEAQVVRRGVAYTLIDTAGLTDTDDPIEAIGVSRAEQAIGTADLMLWLGDEPPPKAALWVHSRSDLPGRVMAPRSYAVEISSRDQPSIDILWGLIERRALAQQPVMDQLVIRQEQRELCRAAIAFLREDHMDDPVIVAEQLRQAHQQLGRIVGLQTTEAMLDALFGRFCIGK